MKIWLKKQMELLKSECVTSKLTQREIETMRWTAEGKTSCDIAIILGISESTVKFHISNVIIKLDCTNKTAASVRLILLELL